MNRLVRTPKDLEDLTLGQLVRDFKQFITSSDPPVLVDNKGNSQGKNGFLKELKQDLTLLVKKRNEFTHKLFSLGKDVSILTNEAQEGIKIANKTLNLLERLENELKIMKTNWQIKQLVYKLYGLTLEEIKIVEGKNDK